MNKIQEYAAKKKAADGGMVDATPETQADLQVLKRKAVSHRNVVNETTHALMRLLLLCKLLFVKQMAKIVLRFSNLGSH